MTASPQVIVQVFACADPVDEWAALDREVSIALAPWKGKIKRLSDLREQFLNQLPSELRGEEEHFIDGTTSRLLISMCDNRRELTWPGKLKLRKLWGATKLLELMTLASKQLPDPEDKQGLYTVKQRSGPRHLTAIPLPTEAAQQAA
jgi:hypothetical protein